MLTIAMTSGTCPPGNEAGWLVLEPVRRELDLPSLVLRPGRHTVGSGENCTIRLRAEGVRPEHCIIEADSHRTVLYADNSRTWHNDGPVRETALRAGDRLALGPIEFRVRTQTSDELRPYPLPAETVPSRPAEPMSIPADVLAPAQNELTALQEQAENLRAEIGDLEAAKQNAATEHDALEQLLEDETRKIREELAREKTSLSMESTLLREQRQRMVLQERALIAQRREIEDFERQVQKQEAAQKEERDRRAAETAQAEQKLAELTELQDRLKHRQAELDEKENGLKAREVELETERRRLEEQQKSGTEATQSKIARIKAQLQSQQKSLAEARQKLQSQEANLRERESVLEECFEEWEAERAELNKHRQQLILQEQKLKEQAAKLEREHDWLKAEQSVQTSLEAEARMWEGYARQAEELSADLADRLARREIEMDQLRRLWEELSQHPEAGSVEEQQEALERQQAIIGVSLRELAAMKRQIDQRTAEQAITQEERAAFEQERELLAVDRAKITEQQKLLDASWDRLQTAEAEFQKLADEEQITLEESRRHLIQREQELEANRIAWEQQKETLVSRNSLPDAADLQAERAALDAEHCQLTAIKQELEQATQRLHEAQWKLANDRVRIQKRANELAAWERRLLAVERQRNNSIEKLTGLLAELNTQYNPDDNWYLGNQQLTF